MWLFAPGDSMHRVSCLVTFEGECRHKHDSCIHRMHLWTVFGGFTRKREHRRTFEKLIDPRYHLMISSTHLMEQLLKPQACINMKNMNDFPNATKWQTLLRSLKPQSLQRQMLENLQTGAEVHSPNQRLEDVLVLGSKENMTDAGIKMPTEVGPPRSMSGKLENKQTTRKSESLFWWYSKCWWGWAVLTMIMMMMRRRRRWRMIHDSWLSTYVTVITRLPSRGLTLWQLSSTLAATEARLCFFPVSTLPETRFGTLQEICSWTLPERQSRASVEIRGIHGHQC